MTCLLAPLVGSTPISLARAFDRSIPFADNVDAQIFFVARLPRVLAGALVGAALAAAGVVFQALLRNPLATPFTLGVSAGASLGAMLAIIFGASVTRRAVLAGAAGQPRRARPSPPAIVYWLATMQGRAMSTSVLLLAGVTLNSFFSALIMFVQYIADFAQVYRAARWLMGDLDVGSFEPIVAALPLIVDRLRDVRAAALVAEPAQRRRRCRGRARRGRRRGRSGWRSSAPRWRPRAAVSLAGPIGFVGIVVPHLVRLMVGVDHRIVLPASALFGAAFLVVCDLVARTLLAPVEIPVGVVTAMIGGPFFLWLLVRKG